MNPIYLDYAATGPVRPEVVDAMLPLLREGFGNPSSPHRWGQAAAAAVARARTELAECLGADPREICFTACGTESNNLALKGYARANRARGNHLVTSAVEHAAVLSVAEDLEREGFELTVVPVDAEGVVNPADVLAAVRPDTILVSLMTGNNETGALQPVGALSGPLRERGICLHTDAVQAFGKIPVSVNDPAVDLLSLSGHKIGGPKGVGVLYVRRGTRLAPLLHGGEQERGLRGGTENVAGIAGLGVAARLAVAELPREGDRLAGLRDALEQGLEAAVPGLLVVGPRRGRLPHILSAVFPGVEAQTLVMALDCEGIAVSPGAACSSGAGKSSHVLAAMGIEPVLVHSGLRFSVGSLTTEQDIARTVQCVAAMAARIRGPNGPGA